MSAEKARQIFVELLANVPPERWDERLAECAGADEGLRQRVKLLLGAHQDDSFLASPAAGLGKTIDDPITERPGTVIGPYKLMEQIGEGGMGLVFVAEQQQPVRRKVALKVIKPGMDTQQVIARFEAERQALALMDHPNIAKVLDGGQTGSGRPYFVMELVKGVPITEYCDQNQVPVRQRLELFLSVCQAVQHAHQKGIIHRDIKPSNVLVMSQDGTPLVKVIDFGVAKAIGQQLTDKTIYTQFTQLVGTPLYMSPEQAGQSGLDVDTRTDIYALGVLLYELLTGTTPLDKERLREVDFDEIRRIIREEEPARPSTRISTLGQAATTASANRKSNPKQLSRLFHGELDWIVMKALEKDRNRRYETASAFAADVQRYLHHEPVQACPPSAWYRFRKFARRKKTVLVMAACTFLALAGIAGGVGWAVRDRSAQEEEVARELAAREQQTAKERLGRVRQVTARAETILDEVDRLERAQKWPEALATIKRAEAALSGEADDAIRQRVGKVRRELEFVARLDRIRQDRATEVKGEWNRTGAARDYARAFRDYYGLDVTALATDEAVRLLGANALLAVPLAAALDDWADVRRALREPESGWKPLVAIVRRLDPDPLRDRLRAMWSAPVTPALQSELLKLAASLDVRRIRPATIAVLAGILARAKLMEPALRILQEGQYAYPEDFWLNLILGDTLFNRQDYAGALRYHSVAVALRPDSPTAHIDLSLDLKDLQKLDEAIACCKRAIEIDHNYPVAHVNLGGLLLAQRKVDEAIVEFRIAIDLDPSESNRVVAAGAHNDLGFALHYKQQLDKAMQEYRKAIDLEPKWSVPHTNLGYALRDKKKPEDAVRELRIALDLDARDVRAHIGVGMVHADKRQFNDAIRAYRIAIGLAFKNAVAHDKLGIALARQGELTEAIAEFRIAIDLEPKMGGFHYNLGTALSNQGKLEDAITEFRKAIALKFDEPRVHCNLGHALRRRGEFTKALKELRRSHELGSKQPGWPYPSAQWVKQCEHLVELETRLPALIAGKSRPANLAEQIELAEVCSLKHLHGDAARFYAAAFDLEPKLAEMLDAHRYNAACAAALAGCGQGRDAARVDENERARLRKQALAWLRAELESWGRELAKEPDKTRPVAERALQHWLTDADLAELRGVDALAKLPEAERQPWQRLWNDATAMLKRAQGKVTSEK
jgi:serine/threonine protein kinase/tetratricopeptide (TPR) repeat protein